MATYIKNICTILKQGKEMTLFSFGFRLRMRIEKKH